jgi:hypothetical protein
MTKLGKPSVRTNRLWGNTRTRVHRMGSNRVIHPTMKFGKTACGIIVLTEIQVLEADKLYKT